ncbi:tannase/feruloyl esterase family alpha/beta hydrolase [Kibdelosporangium aridum]|uniref:tannase/feruloyl esterase family alpha/beta hydrolase n=1 Tax=Kibdelosporangium aridum TaxID=2030 RepID=UPI00069190CC
MFVKIAAAIIPLAVAVPAPATAATAQTCAPIGVSAPSGAKVESVTAVAQASFCDITVTLNHKGANDHVRVKVLLPTQWNGRFQAIGGAGYSAGDFGAGLTAAAASGYAAASTDAGVPLDFLDTSWGLLPDGRVNHPLLKNFASRSLHDLAVVGKQVTQKFYGRMASYSYWNGCSTGGRQGYMEAQRFPDDFDGILATAPAVSWDRFAVATIWPQVVMNEENNFPSPCEFNAFQDAALQGITDPKQLIGKKILCEGKEITISAEDANVVRKIWDGPQPLWAGLPKGASFDGLASTVQDAQGNWFAPGFPVAANWIKTFVKQDPGFDTSTLTYRDFYAVFFASQLKYNHIIGTDSPDLSAFRKSGGKLLTWHGLADQLIPPHGTVNYRKQVDRVMGGHQRVDEFYRVFLAPGVAHCQGGPVPVDAFGALVNWVEHGKAPETLPASDGSQIPRY